MPMTVTEAAIIDLEHQKEAMAARSKNFDPSHLSIERGDMKLTPQSLEALTRPVRIELTFDDPIKTREQLDLLAAAILDAQVLTREHHIGPNRQRVLLRNTIKTAADMLTMMNGKTPTGRRKR